MWTFDDIPDQSGRVAVVTGGNGGLGLETARMLASRGARVVIAARNAEKAEAARKSILASAPDATVEVRSLDVSSLASVRAFAERWLADGTPLDLLANNAGVMAIPRALSVDGYEMQLATNHLGHFALTLQLLPALAEAPAARVVNVSSGVHWAGRLRLDDLDGARSYEPWAAYCQSKLCNLLFTAELDRRLQARNTTVACLCAHPGYAATDLQTTSMQVSRNKVGEAIMRLGNAIFAQSAAMGALATVRAATDPGARGGEYYGPWLMGWRGAPAVAWRSRAARDAALARALWEESERRTGVTLPG